MTGAATIVCLTGFCGTGLLRTFATERLRTLGAGLLYDCMSGNEKSLKIDTTRTQIELLPLNELSALSGAAELIFKGWDKEAIPLIHKKKSMISSFFERFF